MTTTARFALLTAILGSAVFLAGCPGMPGVPGGGGSGQQNTPPGVLPPPGMESGGARTLMGTTIVAPDSAFLLVRHASPGSDAEPPWRSCRRIIVLSDCVLIEGVNYDLRAEGVEKDFNEVVQFSNIESFAWKYEAKPTPPAEEESSAGESDSGRNE